MILIIIRGGGKYEQGEKIEKWIEPISKYFISSLFKVKLLKKALIIKMEKKLVNGL